jgi:hypothetical protein
MKFEFSLINKIWPKKLIYLILNLDQILIFCDTLYLYFLKIGTLYMFEEYHEIHTHNCEVMDLSIVNIFVITILIFVK